MKKLLLLSLVFFAVMTAPFGKVMAQDAKTISYQGMLLDEEGNPLDGDVMMQFEVYNARTDGDQLWGESQNVKVVDGYFNVYLGSNNPIDLPFDETYWLQITVGDGSPYERTKLTYSPYSFSSDISKIAELAQDIEDSSVTFEKLHPDLREVSGDVVGTFPEIYLRDGVVLENIGPGDIETWMLSENISTPPSGPAAGDLTGTYPDPKIADEAVITRNIGSGAVTYSKLQSPSNTNPGTILGWNGTAWVETTVPDWEVGKVKDVITDRGLYIEEDSDGFYNVGIADEGITTEMIGDGEVMSDDLAEGAVDLTKLEPGSEEGQVIYWDGEMWRYNEGTPSRDQILKWDWNDAEDEMVLEWQQDAMSIPFYYDEESTDENGDEQTMFHLIKNYGNPNAIDHAMSLEVANEDANSALALLGSGKEADNYNPVIDIHGAEDEGSAYYGSGALHLETELGSVSGGNTFGSVTTTSITGSNQGNDVIGTYGFTVVGEQEEGDVFGAVYTALTETGDTNGAAIGVVGESYGGGSDVSIGLLGSATDGNYNFGVTGYANATPDEVAQNALPGLSANDVGVFAYADEEDELALYAYGNTQFDGDVEIDGKLWVNDSVAFGDDFWVQGSAQIDESLWVADTVGADSFIGSNGNFANLTATLAEIDELEVVDVLDASTATVTLGNTTTETLTANGYFQALDGAQIDNGLVVDDLQIDNYGVQENMPTDDYHLTNKMYVDMGDSTNRDYVDMRFDTLYNIGADFDGTYTLNGDMTVDGLLQPGAGTVRANDYESTADLTANDIYANNGDFSGTLNVDGVTNLYNNTVVAGPTGSGDGLLVDGTLITTGEAIFTDNVSAATPPTAPAHLTNKQYVDDQDQAILDSLMTGNFDFQGNYTLSGTMTVDGTLQPGTGTVRANDYESTADLTANDIYGSNGEFSGDLNVEGEANLLNGSGGYVFQVVNDAGSGNPGAVLNGDFSAVGNSLFVGSTDFFGSVDVTTGDLTVATNDLNVNAGDVNVMVGNVVAGAPPTMGSHLTNKTYVDAQDAALQTQIDDVQAELDDTQDGAGLDTDGSYIENLGANYISGAEDLNDADVLLDTQVKVNEDDIATNAADIDALETLQDGYIYVGDGTNTATEVAVTGDVTMDNTGTTDISANAVGSPEIADDAVGTSEIATGAVTTDEILDGDVQNIDLANSTVTITPGNGLLTDGDGTLALGETETYSVDVAGLAGAGLVNNAGVFDVNTDATLQVVSDQVGINLANANTWTADQTFPTAYAERFETVDGSFIIDQSTDDVPWINVFNEGTSNAIMELGYGTDAGMADAEYGISFNESAGGTMRAGMGYQAGSWQVGVGDMTAQNGVALNWMSSGATDENRIYVADGDISNPVFYVDSEGDVMANSLTFGTNVVDEIVTTVDASSTDAQLPTAKSVMDAIDANHSLQANYEGGNTIALDDANGNVAISADAAYTGTEMLDLAFTPDGGSTLASAIDATLDGGLMEEADSVQAHIAGVTDDGTTKKISGVSGSVMSGGNPLTYGGLGVETTTGATTTNYAGYFENNSSSADDIAVRIEQNYYGSALEVRTSYPDPIGGSAGSTINSINEAEKGSAGSFTVDNTSNIEPAVAVQSEGDNGVGLRIQTNGQNSTPLEVIGNGSATSDNPAISVTHNDNSNGQAIYAQTDAGTSTILVEQDGIGNAMSLTTSATTGRTISAENLSADGGVAGFYQTDATNANEAVVVQNDGSGAGLYVDAAENALTVNKGSVAFSNSVGTLDDTPSPDEANFTLTNLEHAILIVPAATEAVDVKIPAPSNGDVRNGQTVHVINNSGQQITHVNGVALNTGNEIKDGEAATMIFVNGSISQWFIVK